jgi:hypothetical protein
MPPRIVDNGDDDDDDDIDVLSYERIREPHNIPETRV